MNISVRDGKFDVVIAAGPRVEVWPSPGVRAVSTLCAEMGLTVGQFGGETMIVRGVIPLPGTGGIVVIEDIQKRIHRIKARSIVRIVAESSLPDPFFGWRSQGLIPLSTAEKLLRNSHILWDPITVILGTGNKALKFGSTLLESGASKVLCVESYSQWKAKRYSGWEVEKRQFEILGGKLIEAKPLQLVPKSPLLWQLRLQDQQGVRILDVGRVVSAGPFREPWGVREHPPGSSLFELLQTASQTQMEDVEGWALELERGRWLAGKIAKSLISDLGKKREVLDRIFRRAKVRIKRTQRHQEAPFTPTYEGKWIASTDAKKIRSFQGVPELLHKKQSIASVECFEEIPCNICQTVCPTGAIQMGLTPNTKNPVLKEQLCTACGICIAACPSHSIPLIHEKEDQSLSRLTLAWRGQKAWSVGEFALLVNRKGDHLGSGRVVQISKSPLETAAKTQLVEIELPTHLLWEARGIRRARTPITEDQAFLTAIDHSALAAEKVEIHLNGEKRLVRDRLPISVALFEIGQSRSEDTLLCKDGSCGLCAVSVDSVKKLACQTRIHRGMVIKTSAQSQLDPNHQTLCPCLGITQEQILERLKQGKLQSPEAILSVLHLGAGKCHGQLCMEAFRRVLLDQRLDVTQWIDWRFPWSDWVLCHN